MTYNLLPIFYFIFMIQVWASDNFYIQGTFLRIFILIDPPYHHPPPPRQPGITFCVHCRRELKVWWTEHKLWWWYQVIMWPTLRYLFAIWIWCKHWFCGIQPPPLILIVPTEILVVSDDQTTIKKLPSYNFDRWKEERNLL